MLLNRNIVFLILSLAFSVTKAQDTFQYLEKEITNNLLSNSRQIKVVDLDGDGDKDILAPFSSVLVWFEQLENDLYIEHPLDDFPDNYKRMDFADMDGDGDIDLVATSHATNSGDTDQLIWFENDGNQNFEYHLLSDSIENPTVILCSDYDQDGNMDVITYSQDDSKVYWIQSDSNQVFTEKIINATFTYGYGGTVQLVVDDLDEDGDLDVLGAGENGVYWHKNDGNFVHTSSYLITTSDDARDFEVIDLDADGDKDIVVSIDVGVHYYKNNGTESFTDIDLGFEFNDTPYNLFVKDVENDGDLDITICNPAGHYLHHLINDGIENFTIDTVTVNNKDNNPEDIWVEDMNGDGYMDIVGTVHNDGDVRLYLGNVNGDYERINILGSRARVSKKNVLIDFDFDGDMDVISADFQWHENLNNGRFMHRDIIHEQITVSDIAVLDMDADGDLDLLANHSGLDPRSAWYENDGSFNFTKHQITFSLIYGNGMEDVQVSDFDGDGDFDFVAKKKSPKGIIWYENDGSQNFQLNSIIQDNGIIDYKQVDLDQDGDQDILLGFNVGNPVRWLENDGSQNFTSHNIHDSTDTYSLQSVSYYDFDQDGDLDVFAGKYYKWVLMYENDGNQGFTLDTIFTVGNIPSELQFEDLTNDGLADLIVHNNYFSNISTNVLINNGNGGFDNPILYFYFSTASIGDIDNDGDNDLVALHPTEKKIKLLENVIINDYFHVTVLPFIDDNGNGTLDSNEYLSNINTVQVEPSNFFQLNSGSQNEMYLSTLTDYNFQLMVDSNIWIPSDSLHRQISLDTIFPLDSTIYIGIDNIEDVLLEMDITSQYPRCNEEISHYLTVKNFGNLLDSGFVHYNLDSAVTYISSAPLPDSINGQDLFYKFEDFYTTEEKQVVVNVVLPLNIQTLDYDLSLEADTGLYSVLDTMSFEQLIRCSYDPNDKQVFPNYGEAGYILNDDELEYLIRFQNTGNDTAFVVRIVDSLDQNLNISSFRLISSSHPVSIQVDAFSREAIFLFEDIILTDTVTNEPGSHGFIKYAITPSSNLNFSTEIQNTAEIYFDANSPIITNTTLNTLFDCDSLGAGIEINDDHFYLASLEPLEIVLNQPYIQSVQWILNDTLISTDTASFNYDFSDEGLQELRIVLQNELCILDTTLNLYVVNDLGTMDLDVGVSIYPNPTKGRLFVEFSDEYTDVKWTIRNTLGQSISSGVQEEAEQFELTIPGETGLYFLEIKMGDSAFGPFKVLKE